MAIDTLKIEALNRSMLNTNMYSQQDARQVSAFLFGNSAIALSEICRVALKYADSVPFIKTVEEELEEAHKHYTGKGSRQYIENNVSAEVHLSGDTIESITIICNPEYLRNVPFINSITRTEYLIRVSPADLSVVLGHLKECGLKFPELTKYLKDKGIKEGQLRNMKKDVSYEEGKVTLDKVGERTFAVICAPELQAVVREIKGFKVGKSKHIEVPASSLMTLYTKLSAYSRQGGFELDLSDFNRHVDLKIHTGSFTVTDVLAHGLTVMFRVEYHPIIHETLLNITTVQFVEEYKMWTIHRRHLMEVIERLQNTNLSIDLDKLIDVQDQIDEEYEENSCQLFDYASVPALQRRPPWKHQTDGATRILSERTILLADEMGSGKTFTTILAALSVGMKLGGPLVIVCPSALKLNWVKEIRQLDKRSPICVVEGDEIFQANWVIINYDILDRHSEEIIAMKPKFIAFDESHKIKSITEQGLPGSKRASHSMMIAQFSPYVVSMTGTPMPKGPIDLFNQFKLIDHDLSDDFIYFGTYFCDGRISKNGWNFDGSSNEEELHAILKKCMIRNLKSDCLDLPDKLQTFMPVQVDLTQYREAVAHYMNNKHIHERAYQMVLVGQMKKYLSYAKVPSTIELLEQVLENDDSCVVFSDYTAVIETVTEAVNQRFKGRFHKKVVGAGGQIQQIPIEKVAETITGQDSSTRKFEKCEAFQDGMHKVLICNMKAGGVGLNMTQANKMIMNDLTWLPDDHFQAEDRIHRGGQTKKVEIIYLIAEGAEIDEKLGNVIEERSRMSATIIDGGSHKARQASVLKGVLRYMEEIHTKKRKPGDFVVDVVDGDEEFGDDFDDSVMNDDSGDFDFDLDDIASVGEMTDSMEIADVELTAPVEPVKVYPCVEDGVYLNPPYQLSILSREPMLYQYSKEFQENGYSLAIQLRFHNGNIGFQVVKRYDYTGQLENLKYTRSSQVAGAFGKCDEVGTHILQHLTKIDNYMSKGNLQYAKGSTVALLNTLKKYLK